MRGPRWTWLISCVMVAAAAVVSTGAQPDRPSKPQLDANPRHVREANGTPSAEESRARALERLDNRLEWTRRMTQRFAAAEQRMVEAKQRIAAGEDPDPIMQSLRREMAPDLRVEIRHDHPRAGGQGDIRPDRPGADRPERGERDRPEPFAAATGEQKQRIDRVLEVIVPGLAAHLKQICETERERCEREYARLAERMQDIIQDGVRDPELFELRLDDLRVSAEVVRAAKRLTWLEKRPEQAGEVPETRRVLGTLIAEQFDLRTRIRAEELASLQRERDRIQRQMDQVSGAIQEQREQRERIIEQQIREAIEHARQARRPVDHIRGERPRRPQDRGDN